MELLLNEFLGIRIHDDGLSESFEAIDAANEIADIGDVRVAERTDDFFHRFAGTIGGSEPQCQFNTIAEVHVGVFLSELFGECVGTESAANFDEYVEDVFAGTKSVFAVIGAGAVGFAAFRAAECDAIGATAEAAGDEIVAPGAGGIAIEDADFHFLFAGALFTIAQSNSRKFFLIEWFDGLAFGGWRSESEGDAVFEEHGECGTHVFAERVALGTEQLQAIAAGIIQSHGDDGVIAGQCELEVVACELRLFLNVFDWQLATGEESLAPFFAAAEEFTGLQKCQPGETIEEGEVIQFADCHGHDGKAPGKSNKVLAYCH
jgi:hypothetical protein